MKRYTPKPIDTGRVRLSPEVEAVCERLAENNHEVWAQGRMAEGWTHGPRRDDEKKKHPDLVPYDQLPESEKQYDRSTVIQTIKALIAMGYRIEPDAAPPAKPRAPRKHPKRRRPT